MGMDQAAQGAVFGLVVIIQQRVVEDVLERHLERHRLTGQTVDGPVDPGHGPLLQHGPEFEVIQDDTGFEEIHGHFGVRYPQRG